MGDVYIEMEDLSEETKGGYSRDKEIEIAKSLYDRQDVRQTGQDVLSKVSLLLVRYNKLKDAEKRKEYRLKDAKVTSKDEKEPEEEAKAEAKPEAMLEGKPEEAAKTEEAKPKKPSLSEQRKQIAKAKIENQFNEELQLGINQDRTGGILSSLMLGGSGLGSLGYTLETGDATELKKGSEYIKQVSGSEGTLFEQMSLLENSMTTDGVETAYSMSNKTDEAFLGSSVAGAKYSLRDILREGTKEEMDTINAVTGDGEQTTLDFDAIEAEKENKDTDSYLQKNWMDKDKTIKSVQSAKEQRDSLAKATNIPKKEIKKEEYSEEEQKLFKDMRTPLYSVGGFFGKIGRSRRRSKDKRAARIEWEERMRYLNDLRTKRAQEPPEENFLNDEDSADKSLPKLSDKEMEAVKAAGGNKDKTARNMIEAYRLMGATPQELYLFRLAIIAYMVPTGKKTIRDILNESEEAGYVGNEDLSSDEKMYKTFLSEPTVEGVYVNKFKKKESEKQKALRLTKERFSKLSGEKKIVDKSKYQPETVIEEVDEEDEVEGPLEENEVNVQAKEDEGLDEEQELEGNPEEQKLIEKNEVKEEDEEEENQPPEVMVNGVDETDVMLKNFITSGHRQKFEAKEILKQLQIVVSRGMLNVGLSNDDIQKLKSRWLIEGDKKKEAQLLKKISKITENQ